MNLTPSNLAELAWTQLWQVTLLAVVVAAVVHLAARARPHLAYLLWMLVIVKCLTPPLWSSSALDSLRASASPTRRWTTFRA